MLRHDTHLSGGGCDAKSYKSTLSLSGFPIGTTLFVWIAFVCSNRMITRQAGRDTTRRVELSLSLRGKATEGKGRRRRPIVYGRETERDYQLASGRHTSCCLAASKRNQTRSHTAHPAYSSGPLALARSFSPGAAATRSRPRQRC